MRPCARMQSASESCQNATVWENAECERELPECDRVGECRVRARAARMRPCVSKLGARETARMRPSERECRERTLPECARLLASGERAKLPECDRLRESAESERCQ